MDKFIVEVDKISKKYRISHQQEKYVALRDVLTNVIKGPFGFLWRKISRKSIAREDFWALKNVSFNIEPGEVIGIIGPNGAGKTTLLKVLSRITPPTDGQIKLKGRVASLLEVGTGFHPELTGRENIFLNGAILGMKKMEIKEKFDEIVEFSGIKKFLDTPVKRYSSGMFVRLAFAVAAHLEPEILLIDEVLAVGDVEFQRKCLGKMDDIAKKSGRTIFFVSHNMAAIQSLCKRCIFLNNGKVEMIGDTKKVIQKYLGTTSIGASKKILKDNKQDVSKIKVLSIELLNGIENKFCVSWNRPIEIIIEIEVVEKINQTFFTFGITTLENVPVFTVRHTDSGNELWDLEKGKHKIKIVIDNIFRAGLYNIHLAGFALTRKNIIFYIPNIAQLEISDVSLDNSKYTYQNNGIVNVNAKWDLIK
ncbi:MAG: polysaccharide ABC transporter ATP-binding protein [Patescibacteria group bacterium]